MRSELASHEQRWQMEAASMSGPIEIINPRTMSCTLMEDGVVIATYKVEQCDKCSRLVKFDDFGYQKGYDRNEKIIWFCWDCR